MVDAHDGSGQIPANRHGIFLIVLPAILLAFLLGPIFRFALPGRFLSLCLLVVYSLSVMAGVWAFSSNRRVVRVGWVFLAMHLLGILLANSVTVGKTSTLYMAIMSQVPLVALSVMVQVIYLAKARKITPAHLCSAIFAYILLGILFSFLYLAVWAASDGETFSGIAPWSESLGNRDSVDVVPFLHADVISQLRYFSFVTMTTLGYGDIAPKGDVAPNIAALEALLGQVFLAVFVAHLVSLNIVRRTSEPEA